MPTKIAETKGSDMTVIEAYHAATDLLKIMKIGGQARRDHWGNVVRAHNILAEVEAHVDLANELRAAVPQIINYYDEDGQPIGKGA